MERKVHNSDGYSCTRQWAKAAGEEGEYCLKKRIRSEKHVLHRREGRSEHAEDEPEWDGSICSPTHLIKRGLCEELFPLFANCASLFRPFGI